MRLSIEAELDYKTEDLRTVLLQIEAAENVADQTIVDGSLEIVDCVSHVRVPADENVGTRSWARIRDRLTCVYKATVETLRPEADLASLGQVPMHELPGEQVKFLLPSRFCPSDKFGTFVENEFSGLEGGARVAAMRDWIEENLQYVRGSSDAETTVVDTFIKRQGICRDYAHLMVTLARASNIPARAVSVYAPDVEPPDFHAVAEVYLDGAWYLVDATGMASPETIVRVGVGRDAADIAFLSIYGSNELVSQSVRVDRRPADADTTGVGRGEAAAPRQIGDGPG
jgi:transglutaminase-like putative cysteine protease